MALEVEPLHPTRRAMTIVALHSYLVHPSKSAEEKPKIGGATIGHSGRLFKMLEGVYEKSDKECDIDIAFDPASDGSQVNPCRELLLAYLAAPSLPLGRRLADKLQAVTTGRSGLGLLFLIAGESGGKHKLLVSRFPADSGLLAEQKKEKLTVKFIEKVFMKSATAYKAALFSGTSLKAGFWDGKAVDKQINHGLIDISEYWIKSFLEADFKTTAAAGTKRLAGALRAAIRDADSLPIKEELLAVARLVPNFKGKKESIRSLGRKLSLSAEAISALRDVLPSDRCYTEQFIVSEKEYAKHIAFETTELDNGGILMAPAGMFNKVFKETTVSGAGNKKRFTTEAAIVDRRLRKTKT